MKKALIIIIIIVISLSRIAWSMRSSTAAQPRTTTIPQPKPAKPSLFQQFKETTLGKALFAQPEGGKTFAWRQKTAEDLAHFKRKEGTFTTITRNLSAGYIKQEGKPSQFTIHEYNPITQKQTVYTGPAAIQRWERYQKEHKGEEFISPPAR